MEIECPHCGKTVAVSIGGRKPLNIGVKNIYDALRSYGSVTLAAEELGCSRAYIYNELAKQGTTPKEVLATKQKVSIPLNNRTIRPGTGCSRGEKNDRKS